MSHTCGETGRSPRRMYYVKIASNDEVWSFLLTVCLSTLHGKSSEVYDDVASTLIE